MKTSKMPPQSLVRLTSRAWLQAAANRQTDREIAEELSVTVETVRKRRHQLGIIRTGPLPLTPERQALAKAAKTEVGVLPHQRAASVMVCCSTCRWQTNALLQWEKGYGWRIEHNTKWRLDGPGQLVHVPCGEPMRIYATASYRALTQAIKLYERRTPNGDPDGRADDAD